jgi:two-component system cell cycle sensor histidine kinase/response regulator CckA
MTMPVMDGSSTIRALMRINPAVKIVAASGLNANGDSAKLSELGVRHFLVKPYTAEILLTVLNQVLMLNPSA